ncbi:site-specific integrase [Enterococcus casseliflavus]|uniref:site-specific integrase n=1 Tax=Enterococcus casseliflavus TaxID=37734 RepID=UPI001AD6EFD9|nr:site-specific integrase [Enterococcus casseliflavus]MBO6350045.1 site-specific integrase [Enterococcus casseliflavus]MBO6366934.1 site-specific integrase [Enterococcus casseliflavus]
MVKFKEYQLKNGEKKWLFKTYLGTDINGKAIQTTRRGFKNITEAKEAELQLQLEVKKNIAEKKENKLNNLITFNDVYKKWFKQYKNTVKESTWYKTERIFINHILKDFGNMYVSEITLDYAQEVLNKWFDKTKSKYKRFLNYANNVMDYAIKLQYLKTNPLENLTIPKIIKTIEDNEKELNYYTKDELLDFFESLKLIGNQKAYTFFYLLAFSGIRKGEALALYWEDIDFKEGTLKISKTLTRIANSKLILGTPKSRESYRTISLDKSTIDVLKKWKKQQKKEVVNLKNKKQLIFNNDNNELLSDAKPRKWLMQVQTINKNLKYITVHGYRHTHCSLLFESGATIKQVQKRLGHADVQTTLNIYAHISKKVEKETSKKFADFILNT